MTKADMCRIVPGGLAALSIAWFGVAGCPNSSTNTNLAGSGPVNEVSITEQGAFRVIQANGIPDHETGQFPNPGNPNTIREQMYSFSVPLNPKVASQITPIGMNPFGVALNGVVFDPSAAEYWNNDRNSGWQYEANSGAINLGLDASHAHVQPNGAYHYHAAPTGLIDNLGDGQRLLLVGYAADGFPIYAQYGYVNPQDAASGVRPMQSSYRVRSGNRPSGPRGSYDGTFVQDYEYVTGLGDLDECNGRVGVTPEHPTGIYHYYITNDFPFVPRCFRGTPDASFARQGRSAAP